MNEVTPLTENVGTFSAFATIILLLAFGMLTSLKIASPMKAANVSSPLALCFTVSLLLLMFRFFFDPVLVADEIIWHRLGVQYAEHLLGFAQAPPSITEGKEGYVWLLGFLYVIGGQAPLLPIILNISAQLILCAMLMRLTSVLAVELRDPPEGVHDLAIKLAGLAAALTPTVQFWVPRILREAICATLLLGAVLLLVMFILTRRLGPLLCAIVFAVALGAIRAPVGYATLFGILLALLATSAISGKFRTVKVSALMLASLAAFPMVWNLASTQFELGTEDSAHRYRALSNASSGFAGASQHISEAGIVGILQTSLPRVLAGPFPWELNTTGVMLLAAVDGLSWLTALYLFLRARPLRRILTTRPEAVLESRLWLTLTIFVAILLLILSMSLSNYGILARMRLMPYLIIAPMAACSFATIWINRGVFTEQVALSQSRRQRELR